MNPKNRILHVEFQNSNKMNINELNRDGTINPKFKEMQKLASAGKARKVVIYSLCNCGKLVGNKQGKDKHRCKK